MQFLSHLSSNNNHHQFMNCQHFCTQQGACPQFEHNFEEISTISQQNTCLQGPNTNIQQEFCIQTRQFQHKMTEEKYFYSPFADLGRYCKRDLYQQKRIGREQKMIAHLRQKENANNNLNSTKSKQASITHLQCTADGCNKIFSSLLAFESHFKNKHHAIPQQEELDGEEQGEGINSPYPLCWK